MDTYYAEFTSSVKTKLDEMTPLQDCILPLKEKAANAFGTIAESTVKAKAQLKNSPRAVSVCICCASFGVMASGLFGLITSIVFLRLFNVIIYVYQLGFAAVCVIVEVARYYDVCSIRAVIHNQAAFLELILGRGLLQILTCGLAMTADWTVGEAVLALLLGLCGLVGIIWGVRAVLKVNNLFEELSKELHQEGGESAKNGLLLVQKRFAALDLNGDGRLSKKELEIGCKAFGIDIQPHELDLVMKQLSNNRDGYIDLQDFQEWWFSKKDFTSYII